MTEISHKKQTHATRRQFLGWTLKLGIGCATVPAFATSVRSSPSPNFIVILCDNLGYGDVECFGSQLHKTPNIDRMAAEGMRFTDFYATSGVCTPSRASLMTGCYPRRVNMHVSADGGAVLRPVSKKGLNPDEITIAEVLKSRRYATACIGKWHLGDQLPFLPTRQGFDYYLGIPYSDDMTQRPGRDWPPLPLMENEEVIEAPVDRNLLTKRYTEKAIEFITVNKNRPFFVYLPHAMPGSTRAPFASERFRGRSANGPWGDSVEELDWSTGEILRAVKKLDLDNKTLIVWASDNGAPRRNPPQGLNLPLSGWGYTTAEGGQRVPCIMRWPSMIPAGKTCSELCTMMDLLPTFARLASAQVPTDRIIDGYNIGPLMTGEAGARSPYEAFYYYYMGQLQAVRSGEWKLYLPLEAEWQNFGGKTKPGPARLYDLRVDLRETRNLAEEHPEVVERLLDLAEKARADLGDVDRRGKNQRPAGFVADPTPRQLRKEPLRGDLRFISKRANKSLLSPAYADTLKEYI
jgi:arylsulfatase A-like enzyme